MSWAADRMERWWYPASNAEEQAQRTNEIVGLCGDAYVELCLDDTPTGQAAAKGPQPGASSTTTTLAIPSRTVHLAADEGSRNVTSAATTAALHKSTASSSNRFDDVTALLEAARDDRNLGGLLPNALIARNSLRSGYRLGRALPIETASFLGPAIQLKSSPIVGSPYRNCSRPPASYAHPSQGGPMAASRNSQVPVVARVAARRVFLGPAAAASPAAAPQSLPSPCPSAPAPVHPFEPECNTVLDCMD